MLSKSGCGGLGPPHPLATNHRELMKMKHTALPILGLELGSTRIKAVLVDGAGTPLASGACDWENRLEDGWWTYHLEEVQAGVRTAFAALTGIALITALMSPRVSRSVLRAASTIFGSESVQCSTKSAILPYPAAAKIP
mgnify:CR=1 FL=1